MHHPQSEQAHYPTHKRSDSTCLIYFLQRNPRPGLGHCVPDRNNYAQHTTKRTLGTDALLFDSHTNPRHPKSPDVTTTIDRHESHCQKSFAPYSQPVVTLAISSCKPMYGDTPELYYPRPIQLSISRGNDPTSHLRLSPAQTFMGRDNTLHHPLEMVPKGN